MLQIWLTWALVVAVQTSNESVGQFDLPSLYGTMYGERLVFVLACIAQVICIWAWSPRALSLTHERASFAAVGAALTTLIATPEPARFAYPAAMGLTQAAMAMQMTAWALDYRDRERNAAGVVALMQWAAFALFCYAQAGIGLTPVPQSGIFYLLGPLANYLPTLLGTAALAAATLWKRN